MTLDPQTSLLSAITDYVADRIADRINTARRTQVYTSLDLPARCSRQRRFAELCRRAAACSARPATERSGRAQDAWEASRLRPGDGTTTARSHARGSPELEAEAAAMLRGAGLRLVASKGGAH